MTERIYTLLNYLKNGDYKQFRTDAVPSDGFDLDSFNEYAALFRRFANSEKTIVFENDSFGFNRRTKTYIGHGWGNITPNYARVITDGIDKTMARIKSSIAANAEESKKAYGEFMLNMLESSLIIADNCKEQAEAKNNKKLYDALSEIPRKGATDLYEALVFMKFCIFILRLAGMNHMTLGRFDQYMYPFYLKSKANGADDDEIFELIEEFFISINYDTDLYFGVQRGDNGQSMVLGGFDENGNDMFNELSKMCMDASLELSLIDPKINLRVGKNTPSERYEYATLLTKKGLGFPQYCNDDIVIPGLIKLGYEPKDAYDYSVAACWEFIIPNCAMDVPNRASFDFPNVISKTIHDNLLSCADFDKLMECVRNDIAEECTRIIDRCAHESLQQSPLLSVFVDGCIENLIDAGNHGGKYLNFGSHGTGISTAADSLAAIKKLVYDDKKVSSRELLDALDADFEGYTELRNALRGCPKMGNNDDYVDSVAIDLMDTFAKSLNNRPNGFGGIWRAGTGSAQNYIYSARSCPATADGRKSEEPFASSFSPSLDVKPDGLLSVISSFTKYDLTNIINGGPLTIEIHDTVLRNDIGISKTAALVKCFIDMGGHQLQINSVNRETLIDAQKHPEKYPNLIVRVWGWSGYFNELDIEFQNHIIRRCEFASI